MLENINQTAENQEKRLTVSELLFGALLAIAAVSSIWVSSTLVIHLYSNL
jgi:hypothetical protein